MRTAPSEGKFIVEMLALLRRFFFAQANEKQFYQEKPLLEEAICYPSRYIHERGGKLPMSRYRGILTKIIDTIRRKGAVSQIRRFSVYFLHAVQEHMRHHGDEYLPEAKNLAAGTPISRIVPGALRRFKASINSDQAATQLLADRHKFLASRRTIPKRKNRNSEADLFSSCNRPAKAAQNPRNVPQTFAISADSAGKLLKPARGDSAGA